MKKVSVVLLIAMLLMLLAACSGTTAAKPAATPEPEPTPAARVYDRNKQLEIIEQMKDTWYLKDMTDPWSYTVTDLDHNGRLELTTAYWAGTGHYTYPEYYEISEDETTLEHLKTDCAEGDSWPDIITDSADCYYDAAAGRYYYVFDDLIKTGPNEYLSVLEAVCLHDGMIERTPLAKCQSVFALDGSSETTYMSIDGKTISEEDYRTYSDVYFANCEKTRVSFEWKEENSRQTGPGATTFARNLYDGYGFAHYQCEKTGVYDFSSADSAGIVWEVYLLDSEFNDAERFIPQAYQCALKGDGSLQIEQGQWIYVYCPCNSWTAEEAPENCSYTFELNESKKVSTQNNAGSANTGIVITKNPTSESVNEGGKTWFIAHADNAESLTWIVTDPQGREYGLTDAMNANAGLKLQALEGDTLALTDIPLSFDGWSVQAQFSAKGGSVRTNPATVHVSNFAGAYQTVIKKYADAYSSGNNTMEYALGNGLSEMIADSSKAGYCLKDLDKDGVPELIIAGIDDPYYRNILYAVYTLDNGNPVELLVSRARSRWYLLSDNRLFNEGSSGAAYSSFELFSKSGSSLVLSQGLSTYNNIDEPDGSKYYVTTVTGDEGYADYSKYSSTMTPDEAAAYITGLEQFVWLPDLTPLT